MRYVKIAAAVALATLECADVSATVLPDPVPCSGCFIGELKLAENTNDHTGKTKILDDDLFFVDIQTFVWKAGKGDITDGASIPELFQNIVGAPFEADFLPAAVIHDHYTNKAHRVRSWRDTARVFYEAMIANGVPTAKAKTMYYAVYVFGPHWDMLAKGVPCGHNCQFSFPMDLGVDATGNVVVLSDTLDLPDNVTAVEQAPDYSISHKAELEQLLAQIQQQEIRGTPLSLADLDREAELRHSDNIFVVKQDRQ